jgi:hypothetical protein
LHWGDVVFSEEDDGAFSNAVAALAPFMTHGQFIEILPMPTTPKMLFNLLDSFITAIDSRPRIVCRAEIGDREM